MTIRPFGTAYVLRFIFLYTLGAYLKENGIIGNGYRKVGRKLFWGSWTIYVLTVIVIAATGILLRMPHIFESASHFSGNSSIFALGIAIGIFILVGGKNVKTNRIINTIASSSLAVYLIHDNPYMRMILWHRLFHLDQIVWGSPIIALIILLGASTMVYVIATSIDILRKVMFTWFEMKLVDSWVHMIDRAKQYVDFKIKRGNF